MTEDTFDDRDALAAEYVLGTMDGSERQRFAADLATDPTLKELVDAWRQRLAPLDEAVPPVQPPPYLWASIETAIGTTPHAGLGTNTVRTDEGVWEEIAPGVVLKLLLEDSATGMQSIVIRMDPGARLSSHHHNLMEECMVVEGDLSIGDLHLRAGDYHVAFPDTSHPEITSEAGGLIFIRRETPHHAV